MSINKKSCLVCKKPIYDHSKSKLIQCKDQLSVLVEYYQKEYLKRMQLE